MDLLDLIINICKKTANIEVDLLLAKEEIEKLKSEKQSLINELSALNEEIENNCSHETLRMEK